MASVKVTINPITGESAIELSGVQGGECVNISAGMINRLTGGDESSNQIELKPEYYQEPTAEKNTEVEW